MIAVAAIAVYYNSFAGVFLFDDGPWIVDNASIRQLWPVWSWLTPENSAVIGGRPLVSLSLAVNYAWGGLNPWGYHAVNLAIHILAAWTLFGLVRRTLLLPLPDTSPLPLAGEASFDNGAGAAARLGRDAAGARRRAALDGPSIANPGCHLCHPANRIAHGVVLFAHALLRPAGGDFRCRRALVVLRRRAEQLLRHGDEGSDGHRAAGRAALRSDILERLVSQSAGRSVGTLSCLGGRLGHHRLATAATKFHGGTTGFDVSRFTPWSYFLTEAGRAGALSAAGVLANRPLPSLRLAACRFARSDPLARSDNRRPAGADGLGAGQAAGARILRSRVFSGARPDFQLRSHRRRGLRASHVFAIGGGDGARRSCGLLAV